MKPARARQADSAPLHPAILQLIEALAIAQAREDHEREERAAKSQTR